jgi:hypothetical protein
MYELKEDERWIEGLEGRYFVNTESEIWSTTRKTPKKIKGAVIYDGKRNESTYRVFSACYADGVTETLYFHRCIAKAFIPNPENKKTVNHINGNKQDNSLGNLEWATHKEQILHSYQVLERRLSETEFKLRDEVYRRHVVDSYIKCGNLAESEYVISKWVTEEDFSRNGVPYELFEIKLELSRFKSYLGYWMNLLVFGCCLDNNKSLSETSRITGWEESNISKTRSGSRGKRKMEVYHKYKGNPNYVDKHIVKIRLLYNRSIA